MGKNKDEANRREGMHWAAWLLDDLIKDHGTEEGLKKFKEEMEYRGAMNTPLEVRKNEVQDFEQMVKMHCKKTMCAMTCMVLHDEFDYGKVRLERFISRWNDKVECLETDLCDWADYAEILKEECDVDIDLPESETRAYKERNK